MLLQLPLLLISTVAASVVAQSMLGGTYCEILWGREKLFSVSWNGTGGMCPENPGFFNVTTQDVKNVHGEDVIVIWNGMRTWILDQFIPQSRENTSAAESPEIYEYGAMFPDRSGLIMRKVATLTIDPSTQGPYRTNEVARYQTAVWKAGTTVYELVAPDCKQIYTMQSVFLGRPGLPGIEVEDLPNLSDMLSLPNGWVYRSRVLAEDLVIKGVNGTTPVLQDNLRNSYSQMDSGFDTSLCPSLQTSSVSRLLSISTIVVAVQAFSWLNTHFY